MNVPRCPSSLDMAGKADVCSGCPGRDLCSSQESADLSADKQLAIRMRPIKHKVLVMSGKGGVGKSTVAWWLTCLLKRRGCKTALLDTDICGPSAAHLAGLSPTANRSDGCVVITEWGWKPPVASNGVKLMSPACLLPQSDAAVVFRGPRKTHLVYSMLKNTLWQKLDYLVIDTPPGSSDEHLSLARMLMTNTKPDGVLLVTTPQSLAIGVVRRQLSFCRQAGLPVLGVVVNMASIICPCCNEQSELFSDSSSLSSVFSELNVPVLGRIPFDSQLTLACDRGRDLCEVQLSPQTVQCCQRLVDELQRLCEKVR